MKFFLGIDTSCYTTSAALFSETGCLVGQGRKLLDVQSGKRGLAQSEMVFQHTRNLPEVLEKTFSGQPFDGLLEAVGSTVSPRPVAGSYMPAFLVGKGCGQAIALTHSIPCHFLSHQENHLYAGIWSADGPKHADFLALHVSGGTTELLAVHRSSAEGMKINCLMGSLDISAGQFIDRLGVKLGLDFPAGVHLEKLAAQSNRSFQGDELPVVCRQDGVSFSGPETALTRALDRGKAPADVAAAAQWIVARTLAKAIQRGIAATGLHEILLVGGVTANLFLRQYLSDYFQRKNRRASLFFAAPEYSSDHAVGAAYFAYLTHRS